MKHLFYVLFILSLGVKAQDTIRFANGEVKAVKVQEVGLKEIKYNRFDNVNGPLYVCGKDEVKYIRYSNGSVDTFTNVPKAEPPKEDFQKYEGSNSVSETPAYVHSTPVPTESQEEKINIAGKRLYYQHEGVNDKRLLSMIKDFPDPQTRSIMLKEFSKIPIYKNNRTIGIFLYAGGIVASVGALAASSGPVFLIGTAATITGCILATVNKHKRYKKRVEIARIYNGQQPPSKSR